MKMGRRTKNRQKQIQPQRISSIPNGHQRRYLWRKIVYENNKSLGNTRKSPCALLTRPTRTQSQEDRDEPNSIILQAPEDLENPCIDDLEGLHVDSNVPQAHPYKLRSRTQTL